MLHLSRMPLTLLLVILQLYLSAHNLIMMMSLSIHTVLYDS